MNGSKYSFTDCFVSMITKPFTQRLVIIPQWVKAHQREKKKKIRAGLRLSTYKKRSKFQLKMHFLSFFKV